MIEGDQHWLSNAILDMITMASIIQSINIINISTYEKSKKVPSTHLL